MRIFSPSMQKGSLLISEFVLAILGILLYPISLGWSHFWYKKVYGDSEIWFLAFATLLMLSPLMFAGIFRFIL